MIACVIDVFNSANLLRDNVLNRQSLCTHITNSSFLYFLNYRKKGKWNLQGSPIYSQIGQRRFPLTPTLYYIIYGEWVLHFLVPRGISQWKKKTSRNEALREKKNPEKHINELNHNWMTQGTTPKNSKVHAILVPKRRRDTAT